MDENSDIVDYIREARSVLADSMDTLLNLQHDINCEDDDKITPISHVVELIDMGYDVAHSEKLKKPKLRSLNANLSNIALVDICPLLRFHLFLPRLLQ